VIVAFVDNLDRAGLEVDTLDDVPGARRIAAVGSVRVDRVGRGVLDGQRIALDRIDVEILRPRVVVVEYLPSGW